MILGTARAKIHVYPHPDPIQSLKSTSHLHWVVVIFGEKSQN